AGRVAVAAARDAHEVVGVLVGLAVAVVVDAVARFARERRTRDRVWLHAQIAIGHGRIDRRAFDQALVQARPDLAVVAALAERRERFVDVAVAVAVVAVAQELDEAYLAVRVELDARLGHARGGDVVAAPTVRAVAHDLGEFAGRSRLVLADRR